MSTMPYYCIPGLFNNDEQVLSHLGIIQNR